MRATGLKVRVILGVHILFNISQKIDKIKSQLTEMADLLKPTGAASDDEIEEELDDEEYQALLDAGMLSQRPGGKRRKPGHIIFAESLEEGMSITTPESCVDEILHSEEAW